MITDDLKQYTQPCHDDIESVLCLKRIFEEDYTPAEYVRLLKLLYGFHYPIEQQLLQNKELSEHYQLKERLRYIPLLRDLKYWGVSEETVQQLPMCHQFVVGEKPAQWVGTLYVLEGSMLGGQYIAKHLRERFELKENDGVAYYTGHGKDTMPKWQAFKALVNEQFSAETKHKANLNNMGKAATQTFKGLHAWLEGRPVA